MPTTYAHWRFGNTCIPTLDQDLQTMIRSYREVFDYGVHVPDIFFYYHCLKANKINEYGNYLTKEGSTNNFGELLGCYIALKIAIKNNIKNIFGDSKLIIDYWSLGRIKKNEIAKETVELSEKVTALRKEFEINGGTISHISGDYNPADLGFHK